MPDFSYLIGSIIIAIVTAYFTKFFTLKNIKYELKEKYELDYKKVLLLERIHAIEKIYGLLRHFDLPNVPDGYYGCMTSLDEMNRILSELQDLDKNLIWISDELDVKMANLYNELVSYKQFMVTPEFNSTDIKVFDHKDAFADMVRIDAIDIRILLYELLLQKEDVLESYRNLVEKMKKIPYLRDREKYASIWFDGIYAHTIKKRFR